MAKKKVVVAYSGGLDTSFTVMYLSQEKGYEVYAACANTGGFSEDQLKRTRKTPISWAMKYITPMLLKHYEKSLKYMVYGNSPQRHLPISVSSERIFQGMAIARYANEIRPMPLPMVLLALATTRFGSI